MPRVFGPELQFQGPGSPVPRIDRIHERAVGIITKTNTVKLTPTMTYVKRHACQIVTTSITRQLPAPMTNYFELLSRSKSARNNRLSIALRNFNF